MNDYAFGNFLCFLREQKGLTQAQVASHLGVTAAAVSKWENGESKPRLETLFRLSTLLNVRVEELMAGQYIQESALDKEAVDRIVKRYEYLVAIDSHATVSVKWKRVLAFLIDWNVIGFLFAILPAVILLTNLEELLQTVGKSGMTWIVSGLILLFPLLVSLRDLIGGGRSLGKRILSLEIVDLSSAKKPKTWQLLVRDLFWGLYYVDAFLILLRGRSIGDVVAHTLVISKKQADSPPALSKDKRCTEAETLLCGKTEENVQTEVIRSLNEYRPPHNRTLWMVLGIALAVLLLIGIVFLFLTHQMNQVKQSDSYRLAYDYLFEWEAVSHIDFDDDDVSLTHYAAKLTYDERSDTHSGEETFVFSIRGCGQFTVVTQLSKNEPKIWYDIWSPR